MRGGERKFLKLAKREIESEKMDVNGGVKVKERIWFSASQGLFFSASRSANIEQIGKEQ